MLELFIEAEIVVLTPVVEANPEYPGYVLSTPYEPETVIENDPDSPLEILESSNIFAAAE